MTAPTPRSASPSLLYVATVSATLRHFLGPYARHFHAAGWRVEAACSGADDDAALRVSFDAAHELPLSRSILDVRGLFAGYRALSALLSDRQPDIVHVHTPIASFVTRLAVRRMPAAQRPAVVYTAHGFHFHQGGRWPTNQLFLAVERLAGRWTDRLVVINDEDEAAARQHRIVPSNRLVRMAGIGLDTAFFARANVSDEAVAAARRSVGLAATSPYFVAVGELNSEQAPGRCDRGARAAA